MQHSSAVAMEGREILLQDLRQYCIFANGRQGDVLKMKDGKMSLGHVPKYLMNPMNFYFEYIKLAHELCRSRITLECSQEVMETLAIDTERVDECVDDTFMTKDIDKSDNVVFAQFESEWKDYGHNLYPSIVINGKTFRGRLTPDNVFEAICASFENEPRACMAW